MTEVYAVQVIDYGNTEILDSIWDKKELAEERCSKVWNSDDIWMAKVETIKLNWIDPNLYYEVSGSLGISLDE